LPQILATLISLFVIISSSRSRLCGKLENGSPHGAGD
jgi:hypothetical protein